MRDGRKPDDPGGAQADPPLYQALHAHERLGLSPERRPADASPPGARGLSGDDDRGQVGPQPDDRREFTGNMKEQYSQMLAEEVVPFIDKKYSTLTNAGSRAVQGTGISGYTTFYTAFKYPQLFGKAAAQSAYMVAPLDQELKDLFSKSDKKPIQIYLDWGKYDLRSKVEGWSLVQDSRKFSEFLKKEGYAFVGGELNDGFGWASWRNRTDKILETLFPLKKTMK